MLLHLDVPEFAFQVDGAFRRPELEDHVGRLGYHLCGVLGLDAEDFQVGGHAAWAEAEVESSLAEVVEHGQPARDVERMVLLKTDGGRTHVHVLGLRHGGGDEELRHGDVLVRHRVVLADPELVEAHLVGADGQLHVLVIALRQGLGGVVKRHDEDSGLDGRHGCSSFSLGWSFSGAIVHQRRGHCKMWESGSSGCQVPGFGFSSRIWVRGDLLWRK